jgi:hypothetical protein
MGTQARRVSELRTVTLSAARPKTEGAPAGAYFYLCKPGGVQALRESRWIYNRHRVSAVDQAKQATGETVGAREDTARM